MFYMGARKKINSKLGLASSVGDSRYTLINKKTTYISSTEKFITPRLIFISFFLFIIYLNINILLLNLKFSFSLILLFKRLLKIFKTFK